MSQQTISIVIPTLNEEENLPKVLDLLRQDSSNIKEIIIVDGYSKDKTVEVAKQNKVDKIIFDDKGKGSSLIKGMEAAEGDIVIVMDADLSHQTNEIRIMAAGIEAGFDVVMGSRFIQGGGTSDMTVLRYLGNKFFVLVVNFVWGMQYSDLCYGYRAIRRDAIPKLGLDSDGFDIETEISIKAAKAKLRVLEIPSFEKLRESGVGKLNTFRDGWAILKRIIGELF
ncbi:glycosyltransferase family 2 protein [Candidatus Altiarchaeota archaeon]